MMAATPLRQLAQCGDHRQRHTGGYRLRGVWPIHSRHEIYSYQVYSSYDSVCWKRISFDRQVHDHFFDSIQSAASFGTTLGQTLKPRPWRSQAFWCPGDLRSSCYCLSRSLKLEISCRLDPASRFLLRDTRDYPLLPYLYIYP
jgi:hypothetical protein